MRVGRGWGNVMVHPKGTTRCAPGRGVSYLHIDQVHAGVVDVDVAAPGEGWTRVGRGDGPP